MAEESNYYSKISSRTKLLEEDFISKEFLDDIKDADIIILPHIEKRDAFCSFPEYTIDFIDVLSDDFEGTVEVATDDSNFEPLQIHDIDLIVPIMWIAENILVPVVVDKIINWMRQNNSDSVNVELYKEKNGEIKSFKYKGNSEGLEKAGKLFDKHF